jgi:nitric-oxide synthase, brain
VQDLMRTDSADIYKLVVVQKGHFYVCGDCTMAEHVYRTLKEIIKVHGGMSEAAVETYMLLLRVSAICIFMLLSHLIIICIVCVWHLSL